MTDEKSIDLSGDSDLGVFQRDVVYTDPNSKYPILASYGAGPCVIVAVHNPETGVTGMAHIDAMTAIPQSLGKMFYYIRGETNANLEIHLAGATSNSGGGETLDKIREYLEYRNIPITTEHVDRKGDLGTIFSESLAIDSRTGEIFTKFKPHDVRFAGVETEEDLNNKFQAIQQTFQEATLNTAYDGRGINVAEQDFIEDMQQIFKVSEIEAWHFLSPRYELSKASRDHENLFAADAFDEKLDKIVKKFPELRDDIETLKEKYQSLYTIDGIENRFSQLEGINQYEQALAHSIENILREQEESIPLSVLQEYEKVLEILSQPKSQMGSMILQQQIDKLSEESGLEFNTTSIPSNSKNNPP